MTACGGATPAVPPRPRPAPPPRSNRRRGDAADRGCRPGRRHQPAQHRRRGRSDDDPADRRVLSFNDPQTNILKPMLATSFKPNADASVWTYNLRPGVTFNDGTPMTADDVVYSFQMNTDPDVYVNAGVGLHRRCSSRTASRRSTTRPVEFNLEGARRQLPLPDLLRQLQHDHRAQRLRLHQVGEDLPGTGPFKMTSYQTGRGGDVCPQPQLVGRQGAAGQAAAHLLRQAAAADPGAVGRRRRHRQPDRAPGRRGGAQQPRLQAVGDQVLASTARSRCATIRSRGTTRTCGWRWRCR